MRSKHGETFLPLLFLSVVFCGGLASASLGAEPPSTPIADSLLDRAADYLSVIEPTLVRAPVLGSLAPMQIPIRDVDGNEQRGHMLVPVPPMNSTSPLDPVGDFGPVDQLPRIQSHLVSSTESVYESSALSGSPRQGVMTLDRGYRDAMPGGPPSDHP